MIDFINKWGDEHTGLKPLQIVSMVGIARSKYYDWRERKIKRQQNQPAHSVTPHTSFSN